MHLQLTSLIPTVWALSQFFIDHGGKVAWYPYWYLGNPFYFLIGPFLPFYTLFMYTAFGTSVQSAYWILFIISSVIGALGIFYFCREFGQKKKSGLTASALFFLLPFGFLLLFTQDGLHHIAFAFLPWILIIYKKLLQKWEVKRSFLFVFFLIIALSIDISMLLVILIGCIALLFVQNPQKEVLEAAVFKSILVVCLALATLTVWYTPLYWLVIFSSSSFGGIALGKLIGMVFQFLLQIIPIVAAVLVVKWRKKRPPPLPFFIILFFGSFAFLTVLRFLSDPDFVMDWIAYLLELQFGAALLCGVFFEKISFLHKKYVLFGLFTVLLIIDGLLAKQLFAADVIYQNKITQWLSQNVANTQRIFISGSSVFWINKTTTIAQVRGGGDEASVHPYWADAAYQIREGVDSELAKYWLQILGASFVLVHEANSKDPFHDFHNTEKFSAFPKVAQKDGDILYKVSGVSIARVASDKILSIGRPKNGADAQVLSVYADSFTQSASYQFVDFSTVKIQANVRQAEVISIAQTYMPFWKIVKGDGDIRSDSFGNTIIIPHAFGRQTYLLKFVIPQWITVVDICLSLFLFLSLIFAEKLHTFYKVRLPHISLGLNEDDEE